VGCVTCGAKRRAHAAHGVSGATVGGARYKGAHREVERRRGMHTRRIRPLRTDGRPYRSITSKDIQ
jgi:hypothetical protein